MIKFPHWNPIISFQLEMDVNLLNFIHRGVHCIFVINHTTNQCKGCKYTDMSVCPKREIQWNNTVEYSIKFGPRVCYNPDTWTVYNIQFVR